MRDYAGEMRTVIEAETSGKMWVPSVTAAHIVEKLETTDPELLAGWLRINAVHAIAEAIGDRDRSQRSHVTATAAGRAFATVVSEGKSRPDAVKDWLAVAYTVSAANTHKRLADLTHDDLIFVSGHRRELAAANAFEAALFAALAKKVTTGTVADHFSNEEIAELRSRIKI